MQWMSENKQGKEKLEFYGGTAGGCVPLLTLVAGILYLTVTGQMSLRGFWVAGFGALVVSLILCKDKKKFGEAASRGLQSPVYAVVIVCYVLAGILSHTLRQSGLVDGLIWLTSSAGLSAKMIPVVTFLTAALISTSCGTSNGAIAGVTPILFPLGMSMGCNPALILGAMISGAVFGDNFSPISDVSVTGSLLMKTDPAKTIQDRMKYSFTAGVIALAMFLIVGFTTASGAPAATDIYPEDANRLVMLAIPVLMIVMMTRGASLVCTLMTCDVVGILLACVMGFITPQSVITAKGPIVAGVDGMVGLIMFITFLFMILQLTDESGIFDELIHTIQKVCKNARQAEMMTFGITVLAVVCAATNSPAMCLVGSLVEKLYDAYGIDKKRGANVLAGVACATAGLLPYCSAMMLMYTLAADSNLLPEGFSALSISKFAFYCIASWLLFLFCTVTGFWRKEEKKDAVQGSERVAA